jgi:hypothetical protein
MFNKLLKNNPAQFQVSETGRILGGNHVAELH